MNLWYSDNGFKRFEELSSCAYVFQRIVVRSVASSVAMSKLMRSQQTPVRAKVRSGDSGVTPLLLEIVTNVKGTFGRVSLVDGYLSMFMCKTDLYERTDDGSKSLMFLGPLVSQQTQKARPEWVSGFNAAVPDDAAVMYLGPQHPENHTARARTTRTGVVQEIPGVWCLVMAAPTLTSLQRCIDALLDQAGPECAWWLHPALTSSEVFDTIQCRRFEDMGLAL